MTASTFASLSVGNELSITTADGTRTVRVTEVSGRYVYTTSGKVRPGALSGGAIRELDGEFYFQPTMAQQSRKIVDLAVLA